jgi:ribosome-associated protein
VTASSSVPINAQISIPRSELGFTFVRSSGPGGQNVNKVASKAVLRWAVTKSGSVPEPVRQRFLNRYGRRINERGELLITSQRYRDQAKNVEDCLAKFRELLLSVATVPRPRKKTRVPRAAKEARLVEKRAAAEKKRRRRPPAKDE